jgi:dTDP-4-amino-4,6-dideoxygalactose transaminase
MATTTSTSQLAINGGTPVRQEKFQSWPIWDEREEQALLRTLRSGQWGIGGEETELLERELAQAVGTDYALSVTNGTASLEAALHAAGIGYGDEVIIPPYTFIATATAVLLVGAIPIFADIDPATYCLDPRAAEAAITPRTKAIMPVHIAGNPADMDAICALAARHGLVVIEDAAQAIGAQWDGHSVGSIGDMGSFSFQSSKNINSGEGGAITTNNKALFDAAWSFKNCGRTPNGAWYQHDVIGDNFRMTQFQAAVLRVQLERMDEWANVRSANAEYLVNALRGIEGLLPQEAYSKTTRHGYHSVVLRFQPGAWGSWTRKEFLQALNAEGVPASQGYIPIYNTGAVRDTTHKLRMALGLGDGAPVDCPVNERICAEEAIWLLGQSPLLGTRKDMDDVIEAFAKLRAAV